jgi:hypothetical protein
VSKRPATKTAQPRKRGFTNPTTGRKTTDAPQGWPFGTVAVPRRSAHDVASDVGPAIL